jgi:hypothetical protein
MELGSWVHVSKWTVLCWTNYDISWPRQLLQTLLNTWYQQEMPSSTMSPEQGTRPTSNVTVTSQLWSLIFLSATDGICRMISLSQWHIPKIQLQLKSAISLMVYPEVLICVILWFLISSELMRLMSVRYLCHFSCTVSVQIITYCTCKLHCLPNNIYCTELCAYNGDCQNISKIVVDNNGDDDNLDWICSCNFNEFFNWIFLMILPGRCLSKFTLLFPFTFFLIL